MNCHTLLRRTSDTKQPSWTFKLSYQFKVLVKHSDPAAPHNRRQSEQWKDRQTPDFGEQSEHEDSRRRHD